MQYHQQVNTLLDAKTEEYPKRKFQLTKLLGSGSEGGAFLANATEWGNNPKQVVIKIQKNMKPDEKDFLSRLIDYQIKYENGKNSQYLPTHLIRIYEYFQWQQNHCIVMEVGQEDLYNYIGKSQNVSIQEKEKICFQILYPIRFLHEQKLVHRDIKPENYIKVGNIFKLIDFGLIRSSISENKTQQVGTKIFQAPEILENSSSYTDKVDVWSLGCVYYEILSTQPLFDGQSHQDINRKIKNHKTKPELINNKINQLQTSQQFKNILIQMLFYEENKRPSIEQIYNQFNNYLNPQSIVIQQIVLKPDNLEPQQPQATKQQEQIKPQNTNPTIKFQTNSSEQQNQNKELNLNQEQTKITQEMKKDQIELEEFNQSQLNQIQKIVEDNQIKILEQINSNVESKLNESKNQLQSHDVDIKNLGQKIQDIENNMNKKQEEDKHNQTQIQEQQRKLDEQNKNQIKEIESQIQKEKNDEKQTLDKKLEQFQQQLEQLSQQIDMQRKNIEEQDIEKYIKQEISQENEKLIKQLESKYKNQLDHMQQSLDQVSQTQKEQNDSFISLVKKSQNQVEEIEGQWKNYEQQIYHSLNEMKLQLENLQQSQLTLTQQYRNDNSGQQLQDNQTQGQNITNQYKISSQNIQNKTNDFDQRQVNQNIQDKQIFVQQLNQLTPMLVQDLTYVLQNQSIQNEKNQNNQQSNQQQTSDQQSNIQETTYFQEQKSENPYLNIQSTQEYKNLIQNLRCEFQKQGNQYQDEIKKQQTALAELKNKNKKIKKKNEQQEQQIEQLKNTEKQVQFLIEHFKNKQNLQEFMKKNNKQYLELVELINENNC
ncbi:unnamed protein product [Paramecium pentaurelia]|uniref:Protein kinase domain-containing protein n=1 Tax=Paramecium pentaurelia TaxID=43138 RepID=A0A8S1V519_9CILI|nr:unnamed protein product [Paramecium pentaurelia]